MKKNPGVPPPPTRFGARVSQKKAAVAPPPVKVWRAGRQSPPGATVQRAAASTEASKKAIYDKVYAAAALANAAGAAGAGAGGGGALPVPVVAPPPVALPPPLLMHAPLPALPALPPPPPRFGGAAAAAAYGPVRATKLELEGHCNALAAYWKGWALKGTGQQDAALVIGGAGGHTCAARATLANGTPIMGQFTAAGCHAEMDLIGQADAANQAILSMAVEKEPCPRCAVILKARGLDGIVKYKSNTAKSDYPTWRFPGANQENLAWANLLGVKADLHQADRLLVMNYFKTQNWWI